MCESVAFAYGGINNVLTKFPIFTPRAIVGGTVCAGQASNTGS
jgi:hypothetical protein